MIGDHVSGLSSDITSVLARKGDWNTDKHVKKQGEKQPSSSQTEISEETNPDDLLILDFQPIEL